MSTRQQQIDADIALGYERFDNAPVTLLPPTEVTILVSGKTIHHRAVLDNANLRVIEIAHWRSLALVIAAEDCRHEGWTPTAVLSFRQLAGEDQDYATGQRYYAAVTFEVMPIDVESL